MNTMINTILIKVFLPILIVAGLGITTYKIFAKPIDTMKDVVVSSTGKRIEDVKEYEKRVYGAMVDELENEKLKYYIIMASAFAIIMIFAFNVIKIMLKVDSNFLVYPDKYEVVTKDEADAIRYIKDKMLENKIIKSDRMVTKDSVIALLASSSADNNGNQLMP